MKQGLPHVDKHKVVVLSITYNQSKYIEDTMKGFAMQQTDFPFLCCVFDDASTDGEQDVLRNWIADHCYRDNIEIYDHPLATILMASDKDNPNCIYVVHLQKKNTWGKSEKDEILNYWRNQGEYISLCEGDDYWIFPYKLQKQVDFLDKNSDYVLTHSDFIALNQATGKKIHNASSRYTIYDGNVFEKLFDGCFIRTPTICYRNINLDLEFKDLPDNTFRGDLLLFYNLATKGKFYFMREEMCVYRVLLESASHTSSAEVRKLRWLKYKNLDYFIANYYKLDDVIIKLDSKWFGIDMRNYIATCDYDAFKSLVLPQYNVPYTYKLLFYCCQIKLIMLSVSNFLKFRRKLIPNKWF